MADDTVLQTRDGDIAMLRLNRPERLNAITMELLDTLRAALLRAVDEGARAVLLTGEGRAFCSGADLAGRLDAQDIDVGSNLRDHYNPLIQDMADLPIPIVVAVNGAAAGAGASLALAGDIVVMARSAYLLLAFSNIGLVPDAGSTWLIGQAAGRRKLLEMALLGERVGAEEALATGLVTRVADNERCFEEALAIARRLAAKPTIAMGLIRKQVAHAATASLAQSLALEAEHQAQAAATEDFREGVAAFLQKRPATFVGR